jgi:YbbR domain-containing protein
MAYRDYIVHNFRWKLFSLMLGALTWLTINASHPRNRSAQDSPVLITSTRTLLEVPVGLMTGPENTNHYQLTPAKVEIEIRGTAAELQKLSLRDVRAFVDITDSDDDARLHKSIQVRVPDEFRVITVNPAHANVERVSSSK